MSSEQDKIMSFGPDENFDEIIKITSGLKVPASKKSKEAAWEGLVQSIEAQSNNEVKVIPFPSSKKLWFSVAATILILVTVVSLTYRFSKVEFVVSKGQTATIILPDNSEVTLNSDSKIEYRKYGWLSDRNITLSGEAFFKVKHGNLFSVNTVYSRKIIVTGTKFNVMARGEQFEVKCFEGSVSVQTAKSRSIPLVKGASLAIGKFGETKSSIAIDSIGAPTWINDEYFFTNTSFNLVIDELSRQFNVDIKTMGFNPSEKNFTGFFKGNKLQNALDLVCIPMDLTYIVSPDSTIVTIKKQ